MVNGLFASRARSLLRIALIMNTAVLGLRSRAASGEGVGGDGLAGIGRGIERILAFFKRADYQRSGDLVAPLVGGVERDVDAGCAHKGVVVVVHEGEEYALSPIATGLLPAPLLVREVVEWLRRCRAEEGSVRCEGPEVSRAPVFLDQVGTRAACRHATGEEGSRRNSEQEGCERGEEQGAHNLVSHDGVLLG